MTDWKYIRAFFAYEDGDREALYEAHRRAFDRHERLELSPPFVESSLGSVEILSDDVPEITNKGAIEYYEDEASGLDLLYAPLVEYIASEPDVRSNDGSEDGTSEAQLEAFVEMVKTGYACTDERPIAVYAPSPEQHFLLGDAGQPAFSARSLSNGRLLCLPWLTVFTPPMVEAYGRELLLSAPASRIEELDDGAVLVVCHDSPLDHEVDCRDVAEHLGMEDCRDVR